MFVALYDEDDEVELENNETSWVPNSNTSLFHVDKTDAAYGKCVLIPKLKYTVADYMQECIALGLGTTLIHIYADMNAGPIERVFCRIRDGLETDCTDYMLKQEVHAIVVQKDSSTIVSTAYIYDMNYDNIDSRLGVVGVSLYPEEWCQVCFDCANCGALFMVNNGHANYCPQCGHSLTNENIWYNN